jgi:hypothetical protein
LLLCSDEDKKENVQAVNSAYSANIDGITPGTQFKSPAHVFAGAAWSH